MGAALWEPLVALLPVQPPLAVQLVALVLDQVRVEDPPVVMLVGEAEKETVGAGVVTVTVWIWVAARLPRSMMTLGVEVPTVG